MTRDTILSAAARLFGTEGYHDVSLARIASEVGITVPSVSYYFPSKQALFEEVLRLAWRRLADELGPVIASDSDPEEMLAHVLAAVVAVEAREAALFTTMSTALLSQPNLGTNAVNDTLLPLIDEIEERLRTVAGRQIHPLAPVREMLIYIILAHAGQHQLSRRSPVLARGTANHEPFIVLALVRAVMSWTPEAHVPSPTLAPHPNGHDPSVVEPAVLAGEQHFASPPPVGVSLAEVKSASKVTEQVGAEDASAVMRARITAAARHCFRKLGVAKTTVADVAQEATLSRATVYRYVPGGRAEIVLLVLVQESESRLAPLAEALASKAVFADVMTEGIATAVEAVREDAWLRMLCSAETFRMIVTSADLAAAGQEATRRFIAPFVDPARERGEIRSDLADADIAEWVDRVFLGLLAFESDTVRSPDALRHFVRTFAVTPLLSYDSSVHRNRAGRRSRSLGDRGGH